ncbi:MAG TPA: class I SAM-dependent methyltransferase, partial [Candidatus Dormibacteraeota bacterium]|nr:class I SAM-dependent methyltransferase [Candidatus Dormibacteraeota bacterium]
MTSGNLSAWEQAYTQFETPEEEIAKFTARLVALGARAWPRQAQVVELFCGRGNGLRALERLGFRQLAGIDLSPTLVAQYSGPADCVVGDCRALPYEDESNDIVIVQGGLHHLHKLPDDLELVL